MFGKKGILNIEVLALTGRQLLEELRCDDCAKAGQVLVTPNLDHIVKLQKDEEFYKCYKKAEWVVCDSKILYMAMKLIGRAVPEPIPGSSFFTKFYMYHKDDADCRIFLLGSPSQEIAEMAKENINGKAGREIVIEALSPSYGFERKEGECDDIVHIINDSGANVVLVGVGAPKQEKWIMAYKDKMPMVKVWMALGATIEFEAGTVRRAPRWMQKIALEWLYRLCCAPRRMFKRYFLDDPIFFWYLFKQVIGKYRNPFPSGKNARA